MDSRHRLALATRIHILLERALGGGIEAERMLRDERYARDVLLVCEAMAGTDLPDLAGQYRRAAETAPSSPSQTDRPDDPQPGRRTGSAAAAKALPQARPQRAPLRIASLLNAVFGPLDTPAPLPPAQPAATADDEPAARRWFGLRAPKASAADHVARISPGRSEDR